MRYATLPSTELRMSSISLGTAALGSVVDRRDSFSGSNEGRPTNATLH